MAKKPSHLPDLSPAQREIMEIIWEQPQMAASEVMHVLSKKRKVARNTVRTLLERMENKGWLTHKTAGRTFLYSASRPRRDTVGQKIREIVETVCDGSPETLVSALLDYRGLKPDELKRIRKLLDQAEVGNGKKGAL